MNDTTKEWEKDLRDLYLTITPDEEGLSTKSITFTWGTFEFEANDEKPVSFYLTTQNAIEVFISSLLSSQKQAIVAMIESKKTSVKFNGNPEVTYHVNTTLDDILNALKEL